MSVTYLDMTTVTGKKQTEAPSNRSRSGYGSKIPTSWMLQVNKRWHRVYVIQWSNAGSSYIRAKTGRLFLGGDAEFFLG